MDILTKALDALWQVLLVGILLGAGLPALFALGLRSLNSGRVAAPSTVGVGGYDSSDHAGGEGSSKPRPAGLAGAIVCFTILIAAVLFGIIVIILGNKIFG